MQEQLKAGMDPATGFVHLDSSTAAVMSLMWCMDAEMAAAGGICPGGIAWQGHAALVLLLWQPAGKDVSLQRMLRICQLRQLWQASRNFMLLLLRAS